MDINISNEKLIEFIDLYNTTKTRNKENIKRRTHINKVKKLGQPHDAVEYKNIIDQIKLDTDFLSNNKESFKFYSELQQKRKTIFDKLQSFSDAELDKIINDYKDLKNSIFGNKQYISNFRGENNQMKMKRMSLKQQQN